VVLEGLLADYLDLAGADLAVQLESPIVARTRATTPTPPRYRALSSTSAAELVFARLFRDPTQTMSTVIRRSDRCVNLNRLDLVEAPTTTTSMWALAAFDDVVTGHQL